MPTTTVEVKPEILIWARETAGLKPEDAVKKLDIRDSRGTAALDRLSALETGEDSPTRPMLVKMAKQYRRPLLTFYLSEPPKPGNRGADFRTLPAGYSESQSAQIDTLVRDLHTRQGMVRAVLEEEDEAEVVDFVGSRKMPDGQPSVLRSLHDLFDIDLSAYYNQPTVEAAFKLLRDRAGRRGVFVLLKGDLGSYHTAMDADVFRGFALADRVAPFIVINDRDSRAAWSFTLLHEMVHLILGQTGIDGAKVGSKVERFCNDVAGKFLLPDPELRTLEINSSAGLDERGRLISDFARLRNLSRTMVAYNAYRQSIIGRDDFEALSEVFRDQWKQQRERTQQQEGGPSYYTVRRHRIGDELIGLVRRMMASRALSPSRAARILGATPTQVYKLLESETA